MSAGFSLAPVLWPTVRRIRVSPDGNAAIVPQAGPTPATPTRAYLRRDGRAVTTLLRAAAGLPGGNLRQQRP